MCSLYPSLVIKNGYNVNAPTTSTRSAESTTVAVYNGTNVTSQNHEEMEAFIDENEKEKLFKLLYYDIPIISLLLLWLFTISSAINIPFISSHFEYYSDSTYNTSNSSKMDDDMVSYSNSLTVISSLDMEYRFCISQYIGFIPLTVSITNIYTIILILILIYLKYNNRILFSLMFISFIGIPSSAEYFDCNGDFRCYNGEMSCNQDEDCYVACLGRSACLRASITCPLSDHQCNIQCNGHYACDGASVEGGGDALVVNGEGDYSMLAMQIHCPSNICDITYQGFRALYWANIYGNNGTLHIAPLNDDAVSEDVFGGADIYCPYDNIRGITNNCNIHLRDTSDSMGIYAVESFHDINLECKDPVLCSSAPRIYCLEDYSESCTFTQTPNTTDRWQCQDVSNICNDYLLPTPSPSSLPTDQTFPSAAPTAAPTTSPIKYNPPYSSATTLYVRKYGCNYGDCSDDDGDYDIYCNDNNFYDLFSDQSSKCCAQYEIPTTTSNTISLNCTVINESAVFVNSVISNEYGGGKGVYGEGNQVIKNLCFQVQSGYTCYDPVVTVSFEQIGYLEQENALVHGQYFNVGYQTSTNLLNSVQCTSEYYEECGVFSDCPVDTHSYPGDPGDSPWTADGIHTFYLINGPSVFSGLCDNPRRSMNVKVSVDCTTPVGAGSTCFSMNYVWDCFNAIAGYPNYTECIQNDGNGAINLGAGIFDFDRSVKTKNQQIVFEGAGSEQTTLNHNNLTLFECEWQCHITLNDMKYSALKNNPKIKILNGANVIFENVIFESDAYFISFIIDGYDTNVTFKNCIFKNNIMNNNVFIMDNFANIMVDGCYFYNNTLLSSMHLFQVQNNAILYVTNTIFENNEGDGTIINILKDGTLNMFECIFEGNTNFNSLIGNNNGLTSAISKTKIYPNNICIEPNCLLFLNSDLEIDKLSATIFTPTSSPTNVPTNTEEMISPTQSPTNTNFTDLVEGTLQCGDKMNGSLSKSYDVNYYEFDVNMPVSALFDSCSSSYWVSLWLYDSDWNLMTRSDLEIDADAEYYYYYYYNVMYGYSLPPVDSCDLFVDELYSGTYYVGIGGHSVYYGEYDMLITCNSTHEPPLIPTNDATTEPTTLSPTTATLNPTPNYSIKPTINPIFSNMGTLQFGHTINDSNFITLYLYDFEPSQFLQTTNLLYFGSTNGSVTFMPCDRFESTQFPSTLYSKIPSIPTYLYNEADPLLYGTLLCGLDSECNILCDDDVSCFSSNIIINRSTTSSYIKCNGRASCSSSNIIITSSEQNASILCNETDSCSSAVVTIDDINGFVLECFGSESCVGLTVNIADCINTKIICYDINSCDGIRIWSDSNDIKLEFYNFNNDVLVAVPSDFIDMNLDCNPMNGYLRLNGAEYIKTSLEESVNELFYGNMPCYDVSFDFYNSSKPSCYVSYTYKMDVESLNHLKEYMECYPTIYIDDIVNTTCFGTDSPTNHPTTADPTIGPTFYPTKYPTKKPTRQPTESKQYDSYFGIIYLLEHLLDEDVLQIVENTVAVLRNITYFIEIAYVENEGLAPYLEFNEFWLQINNINNIDLNDVDNDNKFELIESKELLKLNSSILCNKLVCEYILDNYNIFPFQLSVQRKIRQYFDTDNYRTTNITFSVDASQDMLIKELYPETPSYWLDPVILFLIIFIFLMIFFSFLALLHNKQKLPKLPGTNIVDNAFWMCLIVLALQIWDFVSDINLSLEMISESNERKDNVTLKICSILSILFILLPYIINLMMASRIKKFVSNNKAATAYFTHYSSIFILLVCFCGSCYTALNLVSSAIFGLNILNSGLTAYEIAKLSKLKVFGTVFLENIPQLLIQIIYSYTLGGMSNNTYLSFTASTLSVIASVLSYFVEKSDEKNNNRDVVQYYIEIKKDGKEADECISDEELELFLDNKGRTESLQKSLAAIFSIQQRNIEIGKNAMMTNYGAEFHVIQFVNINDDKQKLKNIKNSQNIPNVDDLSAESVLKKIFLMMEYSVNDSFKKHFKINDIKSNFKKYQNSEKEKEENTQKMIELQKNDEYMLNEILTNSDQEEENDIKQQTDGQVHTEEEVDDNEQELATTMAIGDDEGADFQSERPPLDTTLAVMTDDEDTNDELPKEQKQQEEEEEAVSVDGDNE